MNFAALPPEINSALMYTGPGSGPMLAAAAAWDGVAAEGRSLAAAYESMVADLAGGSWLGPSSAAMAAAATSYSAWLGATSAHAEQTATQARTAAAAYEAAFALTVPPAVIAANRAQLAALVATNVLGQNAVAIAAVEALYAEMWAQDAATMYGYAASASTAATLRPFAPAPRTTRPTWQGGQGAAAAQAIGRAVASAAAAAPPQPAAPSFASVIPALALAVSSTSAAVSPSIAGGAWNAAAQNSRILIRNTEGILDNHDELVQADDETHLMEREILDILRGSRSPGLSAAHLPVSAATAQAVSAGKLSVPLSWAAAAPEIRTVAYALPVTGVAAAPAAMAGGPGTAFSQMALAGMGGSALAGGVSRGQGAVAPTPGARLNSTPGEPDKPMPDEPDNPVAELVVGIQKLGQLRDSGLLTAEEFNDQKQRLLYRPLR